MARRRRRARVDRHPTGRLGRRPEQHRHVDGRADVGATSTGEFAGTEFIQYRWYPDAVLDNVFWHDHVDGIHGWGHGLVGQLIVEPYGSTYHDPVTGEQVDSGTLVDIHTTRPLSPGLVNGSFRELALWTINDNDRADYSTLNLKAEPLGDRLDKANQFSSWTYGDPVTPLPRLYPTTRSWSARISVSPTVDTLHLQGGRTLLEPRYTHTTPVGRRARQAAIIDTDPLRRQREVHADLQRHDARHADAPGGLPLRQRQRAAHPAGRVGRRAGPARAGSATSSRCRTSRRRASAYVPPVTDRRPATGRGATGQPVPARRRRPGGSTSARWTGPARSTAPARRTSGLGRGGDQGAHQGDGAAGAARRRGRVRHRQPDERADHARSGSRWARWTAPPAPAA